MAHAHYREVPPMQTERHPLPEHPDHPGVDQWVELRAVSTLRSGDRKAIDRAMDIRVDDQGRAIINASAMAAGDDALLTRIIVSWSYDLPVPVANADSLDHLPLDGEDALRALLKPYWDVINFKSGKTPSKTGSGSSGSNSGSPDTTSPATSPTNTSSTSPATPGTPAPSAGPPIK